MRGRRHFLGLALYEKVFWVELFARYSLIGTICEDISFSLENVMVYYALSFFGDSGILANEMSNCLSA